MVQMGYMYRYNPAVILLREFLSQNWLGEIYEVHAMLGKLILPTIGGNWPSFRAA